MASSSSTNTEHASPISTPIIPHSLTQIVPYLKGQHLFGFLDGTRLAPLPVLTTTADGAAQVIPNPEFQQWHLQDQMLLSALISSLSETILAHVVKCATARDVWQVLERMFTSQSRARTMQVHYQLATLQKGDSTVAEYYHRFTLLADTLAAVNHPLDSFELVSFFLAGLGSEYDSLVTSVQTRADPLSIEDLYGHLLTHEIRLAHHQPAVDLSLANANFTAPTSSARGGRSGKSSTYFQPNRGPTTTNQRTNRGRGRGGRGGSSSHRPTCQVCHKPGHFALQCYHRFDSSYASEARPSMQALLATPSAPQDPNWYTDSGATHHLTADLGNLNLRADDYNGPDQIRVGSGFGEGAASRAE
uniref:Retrotransposon gag domain-containing protein n=1 Tax=Fagus sylvatica TaxID=28930 RepID=A0A2N9F3N8_FAGSY